MSNSLSPPSLTALELLDAADGCVVLGFELTERLNEPYVVMLSLAIADHDTAVSGLVGARCSFRLERGGFDRAIHGIVVKTETIGVVDNQLRARIWVGPFLEWLGSSRRTRAFHGVTALDILQELNRGLGDRAGRIDTAGLGDEHYRVRDLCVQFDETDLAFVQRLLAEEGVTYSFRHDDDEETMVLKPMTAAFHSVAGADDSNPLVVPMKTRALGEPNQETIRALEGSSRMRTAETTAAMWDWKSNPPRARLSRESPLDEDAALPPSSARLGESYAFETYRPVEETEGGPLFEKSDKETKMQGRRHRLEDVRAVGAGDVVGFTDGGTFEVEDHPTSDLNGRYALLTVFHHAELDGTEEGKAVTYENRFTCFRYGTRDDENGYTYAPPRPDKPRAHGPLLGTVVGPAGEEIHTDEFGRIKVRMHWDREGENSVCWVPVGQTWAGPGFGAVFVPRVGMEVVITFVAGDPDRPLCSGVVYNGQNMPPYPLPDHKTRSVLKTASSPGGDGFNELSFEDAAGSEEVFLRAQRNLREVVKAAHSTSVGASQRNTVGGSQTNLVHGDQSNTVEKDQSETVKGDVAFMVEGDRDKTIAGAETVTVQGDREITITGNDTHHVVAAMTQLYDGGRTTTVGGGDTEIVGSGNKSVMVAGGTLGLVSAAGATLAGATHVLKLEAGATLSTSGDFTITNGSSSVASKGGSLTVTADDEIVLCCGTSSIVIKPDSVVVKGESEVKLESGMSKFTAAAGGTTIEGESISSTATGVHDIKGALVKLN